MAVCLEFIDLIIPIEAIERVYPGGFVKWKQDEGVEGQVSGRYWYDEYLLRDGAMGPQVMEDMVREWEQRGLTALAMENGQRVWKDVCVVEGLFRGPTLPCDWLVYDERDRVAYMKGTPRGEVIGPEGLVARIRQSGNGSAGKG
ncbi:MAG: hypothetical protein DA443_09690 [Bacteroidetes bacterium]|jgi:hypothetical protein|nr:MAG: hypothetical protein DA443_09690 [Bacteroidota bacterium]